MGGDGKLDRAREAGHRREYRAYRAQTGEALKAAAGSLDHPKPKPLGVEIIAAGQHRRDIRLGDDSVVAEIPADLRVPQEVAEPGEIAAM